MEETALDVRAGGGDAGAEKVAARRVELNRRRQQLAYAIHALLLMAHAAYTTLGDRAVLEPSRRGLERSRAGCP
jgi:hypothetical protein